MYTDHHHHHMVVGGGGGILNAPSMAQPRPATVFFLSSQAVDRQSGGPSEVHSGVNAGVQLTAIMWNVVL